MTANSVPERIQDEIMMLNSELRGPYTLIRCCHIVAIPEELVGAQIGARIVPQDASATDAGSVFLHRDPIYVNECI